MKCECGLSAKIIETRTRENGMRRRYRCACGARFTTLESAVPGSRCAAPLPSGLNTGAIVIACGLTPAQQAHARRMGREIHPSKAGARACST